MLTRKGGWQHRLQILREAESILNPDEPWPYTELVAEDYLDLPPVDDGLDTIQVHNDGEQGEDMEGASYYGDREERRVPATAKSHATGAKRPKSTGRSLSARLKARHRGSEGSADGSRDGSASDREPQPRGRDSEASQPPAGRWQVQDAPLCVDVVPRLPLPGSAVRLLV